MEKWKIGDVTVTRIVEIELPGITFILRDATPENVKKIPWLKPHFVTEDWEPLASVHTLIVESQGQRIMVDTCIGNGKTLPIPAWCDRDGPFLNDMKEAGFDQDSIDTVLCTHLHMDHVGWNTIKVDGKWVPTFPQAKYLFGRKEWDHWNSQGDERTTTLIEQSIGPILDAGLETLVETDHHLTDEIWLEPTPGHTPGHTSVRISSKGEEGVITGDIMHHPSQLARPHWKCTADTDADLAIVTRTDFMNRFADTPTLVIGTHFSSPTAGHIVRDGDVFRLDV